MSQLNIYINNELHADSSKVIRISNQDAVRFELSSVTDIETDIETRTETEITATEAMEMAKIIAQNIGHSINKQSIKDDAQSIDNDVTNDEVNNDVNTNEHADLLEYPEMTISSDDFCKTTTNGKLTIEKNTLFHDCFGNKVLSVYVDDELLQTVTFNVTTTEERFYNIKRMMVYLMDNEDRILNICLSRSKKARETDKQTSSIESIINLAENIIEIFEGQRHTLHSVLRHRLALVKETVNVQNRYNLNPHEIIENLDQLHQGYSADCITLFGDTYSLENIKRESHVENYDLEENRILLGGLMSMKQLLWLVSLEIKKTHQNIQLSEKYNLNKTSKRLNGYGIEDLYMQLTISGIQEKVDDLLFQVDELLRVFKKELKVSFVGFIPPRLSAFSRQSKFYISLYQCLNDWYELGIPKFAGNAHLTKIESISKIYEIFTLYKLVDGLTARGWQVETQKLSFASQHQSSHSSSYQAGHSLDKRQNNQADTSIPSVIAFRKNKTSLMVYYEKKILGYHPETTKHNDLVALKHYNNPSEYNYYLPDFLIKRQDMDRMDGSGGVNYYILDAKYSHSEVLDKHKTLDALYQKYYCDVAIYDATRNRLHKQGIMSVQAVLPFGNKVLNKWSPKMPQIIPEVSSLFLSQQQNELDKFINLIDL